MGGEGTQPQQDPYFNAEQYKKYRGSYQGKADAERLNEISRSVTDATNGTGVLLQQAQHLLDQDVPIGPYPEQRIRASQHGLGWLPFVPGKDDAARLSDFNRIATGLTLQLTQQTKGAISNQEMEQFQRAVPNWSQSPEGAKHMISAMTQIADRQQQFSEAANQWANTFGGLSIQNHDGLNFDQAWADWSAANPVLKISNAADSETAPDGVPQEVWDVMTPEERNEF